ncbi:hypothetical protein [Sandaracinus amylolyticus]|uniref:Lipoprotein n=1 Tax=Sandaracinus amylolyticus TaxID=927083 RepID=A0A0F6W2T6_9BACT|nr:hypothetical protein [Sandaracinus amylolyticus]AKF05980.1 hypothetical protein DB32_003129 [Sandaracinus amylolyticus]
MRRLVVLSLLLAACGRAPDAPPATPAALDETADPLVPGPTVPDAPSALLSPESRAALDQAPFPMLLLPAEYARGTIVTSGESWVALSYRDDALTISLHATNVAHPVVSDDEVVTAPPPDESVRGEPARVTVNELIRSVAWTEGDVAFALEVECARPEDDARCTERGFVLSLADRLVPAGGAR